nr:uncharacterized protein LOC113397514 [Vanessa tameamea]
MTYHLEKLSADILDEDFANYIKKELEKIRRFVESKSRLHTIEGARLHETIDVGLERKLNSLVLGTHDILTVMADFTDLFQMKMITNSESYFVVIQLSFDYTLIYFLLCIFTELITSKLEKSRKLCRDIVHSSEGEIKRNAKRMLLLLDVKNDISLYDIYTLNARLLVRTLGVVTTYTVIILQFYV